MFFFSIVRQNLMLFYALKILKKINYLQRGKNMSEIIVKHLSCKQIFELLEENL